MVSCAFKYLMITHNGNDGGTLSVGRNLRMDFFILAEERRNYAIATHRLKVLLIGVIFVIPQAMIH